MKSIIQYSDVDVNEEERKIVSRRDAFSRIAFWQLMAFFFLLCFVWASELLDFPAWAFNADPTPFSFFRASLLSAGVIAAAAVAIGVTYEQQRSLLRKLLETCMYCHRVKMSGDKWEHVELYFIKHYPVPMKRKACPACEKMLEDVANESGSTRTAVPPGDG